MTKIYTNAMAIIVMAVIASICFSGFVGGNENVSLAKAAFIFGTALAGGLFSVAVTFATNAKVADEGIASKADYNALVSVLGGLITLASLVMFIDIGVFSDMVAEGIAGGIAGSVSGVITAYAKKDIG